MKTPNSGLEWLDGDHCCLEAVDHVRFFVLCLRCAKSILLSLRRTHIHCDEKPERFCDTCAC